MLLKFLKKKTEFSYKCTHCGKLHSGAPSFSIPQPIYVEDVPESQRESLVNLNSDLCVILPPSDDQDTESIYCIRTILEIPIKGLDTPYSWGVWVTQSRDSFKHYVETFHDDQSNLQSFGWLPITMPYYQSLTPGPSLLHLECEVLWGPQGERPKLILWETDHELSIDQRDGISRRKASKIASMCEHRNETRLNPS